MADLETIPNEVNIDHYGGDTLVLHIKIDPAVVSGRDWNGQVRSVRAHPKIEAEFKFIDTATGVDAVLESADVQRLSSRGPFSGVWDIQLSFAGDDPVTTIAQGSLKIMPDVTRTGA